MTIAEILEKLENEKNNTRFSLLPRICQELFGNPRKKGSHHIFKTPWQGDPRINLQQDRGKAKPYQVEQVIAALSKLEALRRGEKQEIDKVGVSSNVQKKND